jgi:hypothetical protein
MHHDTSWDAPNILSNHIKVKAWGAAKALFFRNIMEGM